ncbi:hypothetical protein N8504_02230 [Akkermansiaceae bacterium]|nr:hypothetical protein [Akkermansiaceae bacterium]
MLHPAEKPTLTLSNFKRDLGSPPAGPLRLSCPTCLGLPGALPVLNEFAIERTILSGMLLGCSTPPTVVWDRKIPPITTGIFTE